jgi:hypothetical protein
VFQGGAGSGLPPLHGRTQEHQKAIGKYTVTIVRSFTEYLGCRVLNKWVPLDIQEVIAKQEKILCSKGRKICVQGNCIFYGLQGGSHAHVMIPLESSRSAKVVV